MRRWTDYFVKGFGGGPRSRKFAWASMNGQQLEDKSLPWTNSVKNAERVFSWNQEPESQKQLIMNVEVLALTPFELFCFNELVNQGKLQPDSPEKTYRVLESLPTAERELLRGAFARSPLAPAREIAP